MSVVLLIVGLVATAVGFFALGMGISLQLTFGNSLIEAGAISAAAGLILIGMSSIIRQLRKIHQALQGRGPAKAETVEAMAPPSVRMTPVAQPSLVPTRAPAPGKPEMDVPQLPEMFSTGAPPPAEPPRMPEPVRMEPPRVPERVPEPRMPEPRMPEHLRMPEPPPRTIEPRFPVTTASEPAPAPAAGPLDWLRSKSKPAAPAMPTPPMPMRPAEPAPSRPPTMEQAPVVDVPDEAPLSPRPPQRPPMMPPAPEHSEPRAWAPPAGRPPEPPADMMPPRVEPPMPLRPAPQPEPPKEGFDLVWPDRAPTTAPANEAAKREPALDMPLPPIPARPNSKPADRRPPGPAKMAAERGPAILKSGVIDGMPYTLYADGSIEAELPQGTVKFASVDALRTHLEKQS